MIALIILVVIHILLVISMFLLAKSSKETKWIEPVAMALIPIVGPILSIIGYLTYHEIDQMKNDIQRINKENK